MALRQRHELRNEISVSASADEVFSFLADPENQRVLHPLIREIEIVDERAGEHDEVIVDLRILDSVPVRFGLHMPVRYHSRMTRRRSTHTISFAAHAPLGIRTNVRWTMHERGDRTDLCEHIELSAPWPLGSFAIRHSEESHEEMFRALERALARIR